MVTAKIIEVIKVTSTTGNGTEENPTREVVDYFTKEGDLLFHEESYYESMAKDNEE